MVDKNLFLHNLAVVAIFKDEAPYFKEWLDYHLLAGVDHFYLYNNDSSDNYKEVLAPYVQAGLVTLTDIPGKMALIPAYIDAIKRFRFFNRYMAFIDLDEFIYPKSDRAVTEVVDEILSHDPNAAGLSIHWQEFGSNGHDKADYSRGVLERFTRRAKKDFYKSFTDSTGNTHSLGNVYFKTISNPRLIEQPLSPHCAIYFEGFHSLDERGTALVPNHGALPVVADKIAINHYRCKSKEEFVDKLRRGSATGYPISAELFAHFDNNDEFDDGILKYRASRAEKFSLENDTGRFNRVAEALLENLSGVTILEAALTCRALSTYLLKKFPNDADAWKICEEASLAAILKSLDGITFADAQILIRELPNLLKLPYPVVKDLREVVSLNLIPLMMSTLRLDCLWQDYRELDYLQNILKE